MGAIASADWGGNGAAVTIDIAEKATIVGKSLLLPGEAALFGTLGWGRA